MMAITADYASVEVRSTSVARAAATGKVTDRLHPGVIGIGVAAYVVLVATLVLGFAGPADSVVPFLIVLVCMVVFVGVPAWMGKSAAKFWRRHGAMEARPGSLGEFLRGRFENGDGKSTGVGALALVTTVPISLALGAMAFVTILNIVR
jgi:hypothetical protein